MQSEEFSNKTVHFFSKSAKRPQRLLIVCEMTIASSVAISCCCCPNFKESFRATPISTLNFLYNIRKIVFKFFFSERFIKLLMAFIHNFLLLLLPSICLLEFRSCEVASAVAGTDLLSRRYWSIFSLLRWGSHFLTLP